LYLPAAVGILPLPYLRRGANAVDRSACSTSRWLGAPALGTECLALAAIFLGLTGCGGFNAQARNTEGVRLFQQARYQEATKQFQEATYADANNADAYYNLAATYHRIGKLEHRQADLDQAETYYNLCLDRNAEHTECYRGLAVLLAEQGRNDETFRLVEGWVQRQPNSADAKIELARLHDEFGHRQTAKEHLIEALAVQPDNPRALTALGKIREDAGESAQALANYQRSLWHDTRQPQVAARVTALQSGASAGAAPPPAVNLGTRTADRSPAPLQ
jgi:tetratricopeptide (TPR) repeat protein